VIYGDSVEAKEHLDSAGWFPGINLTKASSSLVAKFQQSLGGGGADALAIPREWTRQDNTLLAATFSVELSSAEAKPLIAAFTRTLSVDRGNIKIIEIRRIQNTAMWQSCKANTVRPAHRHNHHPTAFLFG
jgi:hypothetical protein